MQAPAPEPVPQLLASLPAVPQLIKAFVQLDNVDAVPELAEPIQRMAAAIADNAGKGVAKSYALTSIGGTFDTAFASVALARALSARKLKTMLLDISPTRPNVQDLMALTDGQGLCELLAGHSDVAKVIVRDHKSAVQVMRLGMPGAILPSQTLAARMPAVLASLAQVYDVVLVNAGEASAATPDAVQGTAAVIFLASAQRQKDAVAAAKTLSARGMRQAYFVKLDTHVAEGALKAAS